MNRKQYFVISWFFLALMFILMALHTLFFLSNTQTLMQAKDISISSYDIYYNVKWAIIAVVIYLCFPLFILFQILGWMESKKR